MTETTQRTRPADLDPSRLHSPAEVRMWKAEVAAYHDSIRQEEAAERLKAQAATEKADRILTEDEYYAFSVQRLAEVQAVQTSREAVAKAARDAQEAYLASLPEVAEVSERSEYLFLLRLQHWLGQGYTVGEDAIQAFLPGFYFVRLNRPAATEARRK